MMKGWAFAQSHADFLVFFFLFWTVVHRTRLVPIATTINGPSALDLANDRKSSFHSSFRRTITKVLCSAWGSPSCQASNTLLCFGKILLFTPSLGRVRRPCRGLEKFFSHRFYNVVTAAAWRTRDCAHRSRHVWLLLFLFFSFGEKGACPK